MPFEFIQPFDVFFRREDRHVIAFFSGHPVYEAVEAFLGRRHGRAPLVRAILTRHDQSQVDYINDRATVAERCAGASRSAREVHFAPVTFEVSGPPDALRVGLRLMSAPGEEIALDFHAAGPVGAEFGGLTDPLGHAPDVLPLLYRDASTVASPATTIAIGGRPYAIARASFTGVDAYFSEGFAIGVFTTGVADLRLLEAPAVLAVGARWTYARDAGRAAYEIAERDGDRIVIVRNPDRSERITARLVDGRLHIAELRVPSASETPDELVLTFDPLLPDPTATGLGHDPTARFAIAVAAHADLMTGRVEPGVAGFTLIPEDPAWASTRALAVTLWAAGDARRVTSTIVPR